MSKRVASILALLVLEMGLPVAAQRRAPAPANPFPATLRVSLDYNYTGDEDIGTINTPLCRTGGWSGDVKLNLFRKQASPALVVYGVSDGSWTASGDCSGTMQFTMGDRECQWTARGNSHGAGSFPSKTSQAELTVFPGTKTFVLAFMLDAPQGHSYHWDAYCDRPPGSGTTDWSFHGAVTGTVSFTGGRPRFVAKADTGWTNDNINGRYHSHAVAIIYDKLRAVPGGPYAIERGDVVNLDGSASEGPIEEYEWSFQPTGDCPTGTPPNTTMKGDKVSFTALCSLTATLAVTEGKERDAKPVAITVKPRAWETKFSQSAEGQLQKVPAPIMRQVRDECNELVWTVEILGGENVPTDEPTADSHDTLYPFPVDGTWDGRGYTPREVTDDGPFRGLWYPVEYGLKVDRKTVVNKYLIPGGPLVLGQSIYDENKRQKTDIDGYLAAIRGHEGLEAKGILGHSGRMQRALRADDPARALERLADTSRDALKRAADDLIRAANSRICRESKDPLPVIWKGQVSFPKDDGTGWLGGYAEVGGTNPAYNTMRGCDDAPTPPPATAPAAGPNLDPCKGRKR